MGVGQGTAPSESGSSRPKSAVAAAAAAVSLKTKSRPMTAMPTKAKKRARAARSRPMSALQREISVLPKHRERVRPQSCVPRSREAAKEFEAMKARNEKELLAKKQMLADNFARKVDVLQITCRKREKEIQRVRELIVEEKKKRKSLGGVVALKSAQKHARKQIVMFEDKLNALHIRSSEAEARIKKTRVEIDAQRRERLAFEKLYASLRLEFKERQRDMAVVLKQSNEAHRARHDACNQLESLKRKNEEEIAEFEEEFARLGAVIEEQIHIYSYVQKSALKRREKELEQRIAAGNLDAEEEAILKSRLKHLAKELQKQEKKLYATRKDMHSFEEAFEKLYESRKHRDIRRIVDEFVKNEDENFAIFNHIQHISKETDRDEDYLENLKKEMEKHKLELVQHEGHRERILSELRNKLGKTTFQLDHMNEVVSEKQARVDELCEATEHLFFVIGCSEFRSAKGLHDVAEEAPACQDVQDASHENEFFLALSFDDRVSEKNIMVHLGVVEQRTNEILQLFRKSCVTQTGELRRDSRVSVGTSFKQQPKKKLPVQSVWPPPKTGKGASQVKIKPPSCINKNSFGSSAIFLKADLNDQEWEEDRPISSAQLREAVTFTSSN